MGKSIGHFVTQAGHHVEYSIVGEGEPILVMHGGHSNCHEDFGYRELLANGYSVITPSRPGYGKTSKELGENISVACKLYLELLDHLCIPQVHIIAISAGGPSGIQFAAAYPLRVRSLVLQSAVTKRWLTPDDKLYKTAQIMFCPSHEKYLWAMIRIMNSIFPNLLFKHMVTSFSKLSSLEVRSQTSENDRVQFKKMLNRQRSGHGFLIDLENTGQDFDSILITIQCPTLIMHSIHDASVPVGHARHAHHLIPDSQLCELDSWGHLIWLGKDSAVMFRKLVSFLNINREREVT